MNLSLVVITLNEADNIERCIRSAPFVKDIVVVDSGSTDETREIAQKLGAKVYSQEWQGFGKQKQSAVDRAKHDWVLCLDADEALSPELADEIKKRFENLDPQTGFYFPRRSFYLGRWIDFGGWYPDYQLRLFNRQFSKWSTSSIHEKVEAAKTERFSNDLLHYVFKNISDQVRTNDRYSGLQSLELSRRGKKFSMFNLLTKPIVKFLENYFWKQGFRDGLPGFIIAVSSGYSVFLKWAKLWEHEKNAK